MDENRQNDERWDDLVSATTKRGVVINLVIPFLLLGVGYALRQAGLFPETPKLGEGTHRMVLYIFGAVAIGELAVAVYIKKMLLRPSRFVDLNKSFVKFAERCVESLTLVFAIGASPAIYGLALYAFGGTIEQFIFFILISLIGYRIIRPKRDELEKLWVNIGGDADDRSS